MDFEKQIGLFYEETGELLEQLETSLLKLETDPGNRELLDTVFRAFHTVKGSSAMFGFDAIARFTHELESAFDAFRQGTDGVPVNAVVKSLKAVDRIRALLESDDTVEERSAREEILTAVRACAGLRPAQEEKTHPADTGTRESGENGVSVFRIVFRPDPDIMKHGWNPAALFSELRTLGECRITAFTSGIPPLEALDPESCRISWLILLSTGRNEDAVRDAFIFVENLAAVTITRLECMPDERESVPLIGEILVEQGALDPAAIPDITVEQKRFGSIAVEKGLIDPERIAVALAEQELVKSRVQENRRKLETSSIRVRHDKLDTLVNLVGELVTLQARLTQEALAAKQPRFQAIAETFGRLTDDLRANAMSIRMVPVSDTFQGFRRLVHDLSEGLGKKIRLDISGGETEFDKSIIDSLRDALMHLVRNAADHGIEPPGARAAAGKQPEGVIRLSADYVGASVQIRVEDDGKGLDREKIARKAAALGLIRDGETDERTIYDAVFAPGFSTAEKTTEISGRGVGMDVVKKSVEKLRGSVDLTSVPGRGTSVALTIPLTLAILDGLLVNVRGNSYILDLSCVEECVDMVGGIGGSGKTGDFILLRGETIPYIVLHREFRLGGSGAGPGRMVIVRAGDKKVGMVVDQVAGQRQVVVKPLPKNYTYTRDVAGTAVLGDGTVALILDADSMIRRRCGHGEASAEP